MSTIRAMRLGIIAPPFFSHFNALEALAAELVARGHRVTFIHQADARGWLRDGAVGFETVGTRSHPPGSLAATLRRAANPGGPLGLRRVIVEMARTTAMLCEALPEVATALHLDGLVCDQMEAAGGLVAEALGLPFVSVACALPVNREPGLPLPVMPFSYGDDERSLAICRGSTQVYDVLMTPHRRTIAAQATRLGLPARDGLHACLSPYAQLSQTVAAFDFPRRQAPAGFHAVGPLRVSRAMQRALPFPVAADRPFVFASLGTLQGHRLPIFRRIARACRALDAQLLIAHCGGLDAAAADRLRADGATWVTDFVDQSAALARADAVVSHGGLNTVMDAVAARTPILVLPIAFDQAGVAARVVHAGIGLRLSRRASARALRDRLATLLDTSSAAAAQRRQRLAALAEALDEAGGVAYAADIVESVLAQHAARTLAPAVPATPYDRASPSPGHGPASDARRAAASAGADPGAVQ
ncbi:glycosyltransferase [Chitinasiproducens palmae]|uniref:Glycosyltransferase, MGT family n=1 Tax=Chitinasiproducens palmae TaxID=1770053 RepID=A0A1H2PPS1_9BURK|nr:glycosyltransferase [Chitinasiproducens palmae]SDV48313.1 glycosyltransferase, MGT family [Chitinasiproducens palmae]